MLGACASACYRTVRQELQARISKALPAAGLISTLRWRRGFTAGRELGERLRRAGIPSWDEPHEGVGAAPAVIPEPIEHLVVLLTPDAANSSSLRDQVRGARQQGKSIPVVSWGSAALPRWLTGVLVFDLDGDWDRLVRHLGSPPGSRTRRAAWWCREALPEPLVERPDLLRQIQDAVLAIAQSSAAPVVLYGPGGSGKSVLAAQLGRVDAMRDFFTGGILWASLGPEPDLLGQLKTIHLALTGASLSAATPDEAAQQLAAKLSGRRCLLVIDDIWDARHLEPFGKLGIEGARLLTTRDSLLVTAGPARTQIRVGALSSTEAVAACFYRRARVGAGLGA